MRKQILALSFLAILATSGVAFAVDQPSAVGEIKKVRGADQGEQTRVFKLVRNPDRSQNGATIVSGDVVVYSTVSDDGISSARTTTSNDGAIAGIAVTNILTSDATTSGNVNDDAGRRNWGFILVHGMTTANITAGGAANCSAGDAFVTSSDAGQISCLQNVSAALEQGQLNAVIRRDSKGGFFYDAPSAATDTSIEVQVDLE